MAIELDPTYDLARLRLAATELRQKGEIAWSKLDEPLRSEAKVNVLCQAARGNIAAQTFLSIDSAEAASLRDQALKWLREALQTATEKSQPSPKYDAKKSLAYLRQDTEFVCVREPAGLMRLSARERQEWDAFWDAVKTVEAPQNVAATSQ
jgi:hypothetical protein